MDAGPENRSFYGFVFSGPFPGGVRVCLCVFKNPARRGMILPLPQVHRNRYATDDFVFKSFVSLTGRRHSGEYRI